MNDLHRTAHCGSILNFHADPGLHGDPASYDHWQRGALVVAGGIEEEGDGPADGRKRLEDSRRFPGRGRGRNGSAGRRLPKNRGPIAFALSRKEWISIVRYVHPT